MYANVVKEKTGGAQNWARLIERTVIGIARTTESEAEMVAYNWLYVTISANTNESMV